MYLPLSSTLRACRIAGVAAAAAAAFLAFATGSRGEDAVLLEPTWKVGKTYTCEHSQDVTITIGAGEQAIRNPVNVAVTFEASVAAHGDKGEKAISFKAGKVRMSMSMFGSKSEYDSEDEGNQSAELAGMIAGILDTKDLLAIYDRNDEFVKFEDTGGPGLKGSGGGAAALAPVRFGRNEIRQLLSYCVRPFPEKPVAKGDAWEEKSNVNLNLGAADMTLKMTAEGNGSDGRPVVTYASNFDVTFAEGTPASGGDGNGKLVGKMVYDPDQAVVREHVTSMEMTVLLNGIEMPVAQESTTKVVKIE